MIPSKFLMRESRVSVCFQRSAHMASWTGILQPTSSALSVARSYRRLMKRKIWLLADRLL